MDADAWMHPVVVRDLPSGFMVLSKLPLKRSNSELVQFKPKTRN